MAKTQRGRPRIIKLSGENEYGVQFPSKWNNNGDTNKLETIVKELSTMYKQYEPGMVMYVEKWRGRVQKTTENALVTQEEWKNILEGEPGDAFKSVTVSRNIAQVVKPENTENRNPDKECMMYEIDEKGKKLAGKLPQIFNLRTMFPYVIKYQNIRERGVGQITQGGSGSVQTLKIEHLGEYCGPPVWAVSDDDKKNPLILVKKEPNDLDGELEQAKKMALLCFSYFNSWTNRPTNDSWAIKWRALWLQLVLRFHYPLASPDKDDITRKFAWVSDQVPSRVFVGVMGVTSPASSYMFNWWGEKDNRHKNTNIDYVVREETEQLNDQGSNEIQNVEQDYENFIDATQLIPRTQSVALNYLWKPDHIQPDDNENNAFPSNTGNTKFEDDKVLPIPKKQFTNETRETNLYSMLKSMSYGQMAELVTMASFLGSAAHINFIWRMSQLYKADGIYHGIRLGKSGENIKIHEDTALEEYCKALPGISQQLGSILAEYVHTTYRNAKLWAVEYPVVWPFGLMKNGKFLVSRIDAILKIGDKTPDGSLVVDIIEVKTKWGQSDTFQKNALTQDRRQILLYAFMLKAQSRDKLIPRNLHLLYISPITPNESGVHKAEKAQIVHYKYEFNNLVGPDVSNEKRHVKRLLATVIKSQSMYVDPYFFMEKPLSKILNPHTSTSKIDNRIDKFSIYKYLNYTTSNKNIKKAIKDVGNISDPENPGFYVTTFQTRKLMVFVNSYGSVASNAITTGSRLQLAENSIYIKSTAAAENNILRAIRANKHARNYNVTVGVPPVPVQNDEVKQKRIQLNTLVKQMADYLFQKIQRIRGRDNLMRLRHIFRAIWGDWKEREGADQLSASKLAMEYIIRTINRGINNVVLDRFDDRILYGGQYGAKTYYIFPHVSQRQFFQINVFNVLLAKENPADPLPALLQEIQNTMEQAIEKYKSRTSDI